MEAASRRLFLAKAGGVMGAGLITAVLRPGAFAGAGQAVRAVKNMPLDELARDEDFWSGIQRAFTVDRSLIYLNNGGSSPAPGVAMEALHRYDEYSNHAPTKTMWRDLKPEYETVRARLALCFGCSPEEIAITRNATESLNNLIFGLELAAGDEVLTTEHEYGSMLAALHQRELREGIEVVKLPVPTPATSQPALVELFRSGITEKTRAILISHVCYLNGQIYPVRKVMELARPRGIEVIVDGAHSFAHFPFQRDDLQCDYFGTSLHKWMCAPIGAGMLYVRKDRIAQVWPLFGLGEPRSDDIRKFELIGTHPAGHRLAVSEAVALHESIGAERKAARLRFLRDRWAQRFAGDSRVTFHSNLNDTDSCAIATAGVRGITPGELAGYLFSQHRIIVTTIDQAGVCGIRVSPSIYTTLREVDLFADAFAHVLEHGL
ncbi:MAG: aminotransferase class V-fold PLP-dependent enzyme [Planctomycetota bacterium]